MGQEFFVNNQSLENKVRELLPSQGGAGAGFDLSASTQIIPIIDLTESAEGSNVRSDLQTSLSHSKITSFNVSNATTILVNNTGYFRVFGNFNVENFDVAKKVELNLFDGTTSKILASLETTTTLSQQSIFALPFDFVVFLEAGNSLRVISTEVDAICSGCTRQIASIDGTLISP